MVKLLMQACLQLEELKEQLRNRQAVENGTGSRDTGLPGGETAPAYVAPAVTDDEKEREAGSEVRGTDGSEVVADEHSTAAARPQFLQAWQIEAAFADNEAEAAHSAEANSLGCSLSPIPRAKSWSGACRQDGLQADAQHRFAHSHESPARPSSVPRLCVCVRARRRACVWVRNHARMVCGAPQAPEELLFVPLMCLHPHLETSLSCLIAFLDANHLPVSPSLHQHPPSCLRPAPPSCSLRLEALLYNTQAVVQLSQEVRN